MITRLSESSEPGQFAVGEYPDRSTPDGELRWLRAAADEAKRSFEARRNHHNEIRWAQADIAVEAHLEQHPELRP